MWTTVDPSQSDSLAFAADGAAAGRVLRGGEERLEVHDRDGRLLFEYNPSTGRGTLSIPDGNLELRAPHGDLIFHAGRAVRIQADHEVDVSGERLSLSANEGDVRLAHAHYRGRDVRAELNSARFVLDKLETIVRRCLLRAGDLFRFVRGLDQLKAGRTRTLVKSGSSLQAESIHLRAQGKVCVDGERIHLG